MGFNKLYCNVCYKIYQVLTFNTIIRQHEYVCISCENLSDDVAKIINLRRNVAHQLYGGQHCPQ